MKTKSSSVIVLICLSLFIYALPLLPQTFTLEDVLSAPYPTNLIAAAKADRIAWVANDRGVRNIWTAAAPDFQARKLTDYTEDDGQVLGSLQLTPDGSILVYVRGGNTNRAGEHANPTSDPEGAEQAIWAIRTTGAQPWKLAAGQRPVLSPDGGEVIFSRKGQFFAIKAVQKENGNEETTKPQPLFKTRGRNANPQWSPDGSRIAFVSRRGDHSFIGVYAIESKAIHWISPGVDRDTNPVWSPDGTQIAYIRAPGLKKHELRNLTGGNPFSIWVANVQTGGAQQLWHSPADDGGFAQYYPAAPLRWTANNRLLFYSEHENWMHIYSLAADGGALTDLTPGNSEAEHSALSPDGRFLYFSSNQGDIDRRDIWKTSTVTGNPFQITRGEGIETDPIPLASGQTIAFRGGGTTTPTAIQIANSDGTNSRAIYPGNLPKDFPQKLLVTPQQAIFKAADGREIHGQLFLPRNAKAGDKRPALIFMHGGPIRQMLLGWHYRGYYANAYAMNQYLANQGYVVLAVNYRSGIGYGRAFRRAEKQGPRGAAEYQDIVAAGKYLQQRPEVDPDLVGLWGGSYGGYLTAMGLARNSDLFKAGVDLHGVHDWKFRGTDFSPGGGWALQGDELLELAYQSSPVADLSKWKSPVLLIHGDDDRNVLFQQTTDLVQQLRERKVHVETLIFPDEVHGFLRHESWQRAYRATADFFDRFLQAEVKTTAR